jgi:hypothetical protein
MTYGYIMNFKNTALFIGSVAASVSSIAQPVLMTELSKGDSWFSADVAKASSLYKYSENGVNDSSKNSADIFDVTAISVASNTQSFTPFLAASFTKYSSDIEKQRLKVVTPVGYLILMKAEKHLY